MKRSWLWWLAIPVCLAGLGIHAWNVWEAWLDALARYWAGADFATFYYAYDAVVQGVNPYRPHELNAVVAEGGVRQSVYPFFYPPPFLLLMTWTDGLTLSEGYGVWYWFNESLVLALAGLLWWPWRKRVGPMAVLLCVLLAFGTVIPENLKMGQVNLLVMAFVLGGLFVSRKGYEAAGGALIGVACMMKMAPALFIIDALVRGRWRVVAGSVVMALAMSVLMLGWMDVAKQWYFYRDILPQFASGRYNGLSIGIDFIGNHSLANWWDQVWPPVGKHRTLTPRAGHASSLTMFVVFTLTFGVSWLRRGVRSPLADAARTGAVAAAMLIVPVFTYEHHLIWLWPGLIAVAAALWLGVLHKSLWPVWLLACGAWCASLASVLKLKRSVMATSWWAGWLCQESKAVAILGVWALCLGVLASLKSRQVQL